MRVFAYLAGGGSEQPLSKLMYLSYFLIFLLNIFYFSCIGIFLGLMPCFFWFCWTLLCFLVRFDGAFKCVDGSAFGGVCNGGGV